MSKIFNDNSLYGICSSISLIGDIFGIFQSLGRVLETKESLSKIANDRANCLEHLFRM